MTIVKGCGGEAARAVGHRVGPGVPAGIRHRHGGSWVEALPRVLRDGRWLRVRRKGFHDALACCLH